MSENKKVLFVLTSVSEIPDTEKETGFWMEEFATPYYTFQDAGVDVDIASIDGGEAHPDPASMSKDHEALKRLEADPGVLAKLDQTVPVSRVHINGYQGIFMPGGHGTMWDFPENPILSRLISDFYADHRIIGAVCHGPAALVGPEKPDGRPLVEGHRINAFTNEEEKQAKLEEVVPFLLESRLKKLGARFESTEAFQPHAVRDGVLVTGQNPASSEETAKLMLEALQKG